MGISELFLLSTASIHGVYDKEILKIVSITSDLVFLYCGGGRHFVVFYGFHQNQEYLFQFTFNIHQYAFLLIKKMIFKFDLL